MKNENAVIIVNWNQPQITSACIRSALKKQRDYDVFVVDNGSTDNSINHFKKFKTKIFQINIKNNLGFAGACNYAAYFIKRTNKSIKNFLFLNNDTLVEKNALSVLFANLRKDKKTGITTPLILHYPEKRKVWAAGTNFSNWSFTPKRAFAGKVLQKNIFMPRNLKWATGCCLCIRSKLFFQVRGFWDALFMSAEDLDLSFKVIKKGFAIKFVPQSTVYHREAVSSGGNDCATYVYYQTRNDLAVRKKWRVASRFIVFGKFFIFNLLRCSKFFLSGNFSSIKTCVLGIIHGFFGKLGKYKKSN